MSKKMCPKPSPKKDIAAQGTDGGGRLGIAAILQYESPVYRENPCGSYIEFKAFDPESGKMRRKTIKLNRIKGSNKRRAYARDVMARLNDQLKRGWNPWVAKDVANLATVEEALDRYEANISKMLANGYYRKETYAGYTSYTKILREYIAKERKIYYCYQIDRKFCSSFLDYVFIDRNNGAQTRNNYLGYLRVLSAYLVEKGYLQSKPTDGIQPINKRLYAKERECIPLDKVKLIADHCKKNDPNFLFACYLLYYCFIRPVEMTRLKVRQFNLKQCTLTVYGEGSKNKTTQTVTLPKKVIEYGITIGVFSAPMDDFIFSAKLLPGKDKIDPKIFRDHWEKVRKALGLKKQWKFYSLKDTGITEMFDNNLPTISVRDQARHSSLAITDIYTRHNAKANEDIIGLDGAL